MGKQLLFHVVLQGRKVGPYDRRTIVGMRIKGTLDSAHVLIDTDGNQITVADLIGRRAGDDDFQPNRTAGQSVVQATYAASLRGVSGRGHGIPAFHGEVELRVQNDALRIAGRFRKGLGWKEDRVKLPLKDIIHASARGSEVELGLRVADGSGLHALRLELFTADTAAELVSRLPVATAWPQGKPRDAVVVSSMPWLLVGRAALVAGVVLVLVLAWRLY
jgi:hypothetical protein